MRWCRCERYEVQFTNCAKRLAETAAAGAAEAEEGTGEGSQEKPDVTESRDVDALAALDSHSESLKRKQ